MKEIIKVAEFVTRLEFGGVESVLLSYLPYLDKKFEVHVITQDINAEACIEQFEKNGVIVHIVTHKRKSIKKNVIEVYRLLKKEKFQIVHSHMTLTNFYVLFLAWLTGVKIRISHSHNAFKSPSTKQKIVWSVIKILNKMSANVWAACGVEAGEFLFGINAVKKNKVYIMNNAIDTSKYAFDKEICQQVRGKYGIADELCVGHIGRFMEQKNHKYLIDIFKAVLTKSNNAKLLLVGTGELEQEIKGYVNALGIQENVIFVGSTTEPERYYQAMDVFVLPSLFEGLPVVSIEAQTAGLPCVISDNVDKRCKLTNTVSFMSIEESPECWAEQIIDMWHEGRNNDAVKMIKEARYDISNEAKVLNELYALAKK